MKIKTSDLIGPALDWAVAKCEGPDSVASCYYDDDQLLWLEEAPANEWSPSTDWSQGGPIIEREGIALLPEHEWCGYIDNIRSQKYGPTPLIAAMRCYVASKLGDIIDIPEELK
jgi:hypothetical protein